MCYSCCKHETCRRIGVAARFQKIIPNQQEDIMNTEFYVGNRKRFLEKLEENSVDF